jgi:protein TonB
VSLAVTGWSSAIAPEAPPVPRPAHWLGGLALAALLLTLWALRYAAPPEMIATSEEAGVVVSLGGPVRRLEAPPPEVATAEEATKVAERAENAPPPEAPPAPRVIAGASDGEGRASSGTSAGPSRLPPAPPPPPRAAPPAPPRPTRVSRQFTEVSIRAYTALIVYPQSSLDREEEGQGVIKVTIARDGQVLDWQLVRSTGHQRLDDEIRRVAGRVRRLDPLPPDFGRDTAEVDIPITFTIEYFDG